MALSCCLRFGVPPMLAVEPDGHRWCFEMFLLQVKGNIFFFVSLKSHWWEFHSQVFSPWIKNPIAQKAILDKHPALFLLHDFETSLKDNWQPCGEGKILAGSSDPLHLIIASPELYILLHFIAKVNLREQVFYSSARICVSPLLLS